ncbi:Protein-tyrosine kinase 6 [Cytospora mali]|uniref:Protein-tyrosine kinase 6 n=1 Tax=Cytospora mali TaxID=578113 RepID=A0A194W956_CYTMA|nr:Protein-tyrosine kinase 6 [Valsa mali]
MSSQTIFTYTIRQSIPHPPPGTTSHITTDSLPKILHHGFVFGINLEAADITWCTTWNPPPPSSRCFSIGVDLESPEDGLLLRTTGQSTDFTAVGTSCLKLGWGTTFGMLCFDVFIEIQLPALGSVNTALWRQYFEMVRSEVLTLGGPGLLVSNLPQIMAPIKPGWLFNMRADQAFNQRTGAMVVCKRAPHLKSYMEASLEHKFLKNVQHPHILQFMFNCVDGPGQFYGISELLPYPTRTLSTMTKMSDLERDKDALTVSELVDINGQVLQALKFLDSQKITHGNLTPSSIFICMRSPDAIIVRVGDLRPTSHPLLLQSHDKNGTSGRYIAPEWHQGELPTGASSDVWSLGVITLEFSFGLPNDYVNWVGQWNHFEWPERLFANSHSLSTQPSLRDWIILLCHPNAALRARILVEFGPFEYSQLKSGMFCMGCVAEAWGFGRHDGPCVRTLPRQLRPELPVASLQPQGTFH